MEVVGSQEAAFFIDLLPPRRHAERKEVASVTNERGRELLKDYDRWQELVEHESEIAKQITQIKRGEAPSEKELLDLCPQLESVKREMCELEEKLPLNGEELEQLEEKRARRAEIKGRLESEKLPPDKEPGLRLHLKSIERQMCEILEGAEKRKKKE